jgi:hypothetical protein
MRVTAVRLRLLLLFVGSLVLHFCICACSYLKGMMYAEDFESLTLQILAIYSIPLGVILGAFFAQGKLPVPSGSSAFHAAFVLSFLWNALLIVRSLIFLFGKEDFVGDFTSFLQKASAASSFLIAGVLSFFFAKKG